MHKPLYLVDASIYIFRAYFSLPERWHSPEGYPLNAVYGYTSFLLDLFKDLGEGEEHHLVAAFDESLGSCFRNDIYADYKVSRELPDEALAFQLSACRQVTELLGIDCFGGRVYEADDYIATLARHGRDRGHPVTIISRDKDLGQLLQEESDRLWDFAAGSRMDRNDFFEKFGVTPEQFADYQGLVGDAVDDIPGVPAVGAKTAARLIQEFGDLDSLAERRHELGGLGLRGAARISANLEAHWPLALLSRELTRLAENIEKAELPAAHRLEADSLSALVEYLESISLSGGVLNRCRALKRKLED
jgi:5'-3' exonuclease